MKEETLLPKLNKVSLKHELDELRQTSPDFKYHKQQQFLKKKF